MADRGSRYTVAIIGLGRIASTIDDEVRGSPSTMLPFSHMTCWRETPGVEVVAAADSYAEQREAFGRRWGLDEIYADYRQMLERERPDIVSVTTSAKPRPRIVIDCAEAGVRGIYAEKPIAFSLAEADAMLAACRERGVTLMVGTARRYDPLLAMARQMIDSGRLGRILQVTAYAHANISHNGSHVLDTVRFLAADGNPTWVFGEMESDEKAATDEDLMGNGYVAFDNEARAYARMMPTGPAYWEFDVISEEGRLRSLANQHQVKWWQRLPGGSHEDLVERLFPRPQRMLSPQLGATHDMVHCLDTGATPLASGAAGATALEIAIALRESHRQGGRRIDLPLPDRSLRIRSAETLRGDLPEALRPTQSS